MQRVCVIDVSGRPVLGLACRGQIADLSLAVRLMRTTRGEDARSAPSFPRRLGSWVWRGRGVVEELEEVARWLGRRPAVPVGEALWHPPVGTAWLASLPVEGRIFCLGGGQDPPDGSAVLSRVRIKVGLTAAGPASRLVCGKAIERFEIEPSWAVVVGQELDHVRPDAAQKAILGVSLFLDCRARVTKELASDDLAGNVDGSSPTTPWLAVGEGWEGVLAEPIRLTVAGETVSTGPSGWTVDVIGEALSALSQWLVLQPGDMVAVPACSAPKVTAGPQAQVELEGPTLGSLRLRIEADAR